MKCQNICELCQLYDEIRKTDDYFSGRKVALLLTVLQFPLKECQTGAPVEKLNNMARRESRCYFDEHQK